MNRSLHIYNGGFAVRIAAKTNHGLERIDQRNLSAKQVEVLGQIKLQRVLFKKEQISEIRTIIVDKLEYPVSIVVDDVVLGVHPRNLPQSAIRAGFGTREGENYAVVKTVLAHPNENTGRKFVGEYQVAG